MSKLSVVVPAYNTGAYIDKCLESICNQTLSDIEIIVVEQNSNDDTYIMPEKEQMQMKGLN